MKIPGFLLNRKADSHKYDYGYVLVIGGSPGLVGAPCLCAQAALKIGAGLVRAAVPKSLNSIFEMNLLEVMTLPVADKGGYFCERSFDAIKPLLGKIDVLAIGCGASVNKETQSFLRKIVQTVDKPMVVDADALTALAGHMMTLEKRRASNVVLTPHVGEFSRMTGVDNNRIINQRKELVKKFALRYNLTLVLKGDHTLVSDGKAFFENSTGNPAMAKAGTGDVLSGMIAGLMAQGLSGFDAARLGVYLHGLSGDLAAKAKTEMCLLASDIIDYLPEAIKATR
jgi:ADP-dependent NAD(P)H-hydrate dehydratase / NAD(P)H-hydrate epimerase